VEDFQLMTLRDVLRQKGLGEWAIRDVLLLLHYKPERAQLVFYYLAQGFTQTETAEKIGITQRSVHYHRSKTLADIDAYLRNPPDL